MLRRRFRREVTHCELCASIDALLEATAAFFTRYNRRPDRVRSIIGAIPHDFRSCTQAALPFSLHPGRCVAGSGCAGGAGMVVRLAARDGSGRSSPRPATPPRPLMRLRARSLCRAMPARQGGAAATVTSRR